jgi:5-methylcytosine-specific restriction endonuclease McrA
MSSKKKQLEALYGHVCSSCGYTGYLEVHHKISVINGGSNKIENLTLLCELCHCETHGTTKKHYLDGNRKGWKAN